MFAEPWKMIEAMFAVKLDGNLSSGFETVFHRPIYFVRDLAAGSLVTREDIRRIRHSLGLAPKYFDEILGKKVKYEIQSGTAAHWELFE